FFLASMVRGPIANVLALFYLGASALVTGSVTLHAAILTIVMSIIIVNFLSAIYLWGLCTENDKKVGAVAVSGQGNSTAEILALSWPLMFSQLAMFIAVQSDIWIIQAFAGSSDLANYGAAAK